MKKNGINFTYFVTGNPFLIKSFEKRWSKVPHLVHNLVRIRDIDWQLREMPIENAWMMKIGFSGAKFLNDVRRKLVSTGSRHSDVKITRFDSFDYRFDEFWDQISPQYNYIVERRRDYLNWRYCDPRAGDFVLHVAEEDDKVKGYCVLRINRYRKEYPVGFIVDLLALSERDDVVNALASNACDYFDGEDVNIVNYQVIQSHRYGKILKNHGFLDSRTRLHLFCHPFEIEDDFSRIKGIPANEAYFSYGDIDTLPVDLPIAR